LRLGLPAAFALLLLGSNPVLRARPFDPGCPVPFAAIADHTRPIDGTCPSLRGNIPDSPADANDAAKALQNLAKNNLCATGTPVLVTFYSFKQLQQKLDQKIPAALHWDRDHLPGDRSAYKTFCTTSDGALIGEGSVVRLSAWFLEVKDWR
jgi:hypothetical protein